MDPDTGVPVERVLHPPAVHFKGKGFYNTDYGTRKRQRETAAAAERSGDSKKGDKDGGSDSSATPAAGKDKPAPAAKTDAKKAAADTK